jgi:hypothetical protein
MSRSPPYAVREAAIRHDDRSMRIPAKLNAESDQAERGFRASRTLIGAQRRQSVS